VANQHGQPICSQCAKSPGGMIGKTRLQGIKTLTTRSKQLQEDFLEEGNQTLP
jgi:hypothetical protein